MIEVIVEPHAKGRLAGKYDIHVQDSANHRLLVYSHQGYENPAFAEALARRLFARDGHHEAVRRIKALLDQVSDATLGVKSEILTIFASIEQPEPVDLIVRRLDGKGKSEMIR